MTVNKLKARLCPAPRHLQPHHRTGTYTRCISASRGIRRDKQDEIFACQHYCTKFEQLVLSTTTKFLPTKSKLLTQKQPII